MRVLHVHRIRGISGSERHLLTLLPALRERGVDVRFLGLDDPDGTPQEFYDELQAARLAYERVAAPRDLSPLLAWRVGTRVRDIRSDVVHTHLVHADAYGAVGAVLARSTLVSTKHNDDPFRAGVFRFVDRTLTRRATRVIAITDALARFTIERVGLPASKVSVVRYGLDEPPPRRGVVVPVSDGDRLLLSIGRLVPQKGHDVAVRALAELRRSRPDVALAVLGEGPERGRLESLARELGVADALVLPGNVHEVGDWLARADVLVHSARWEGFGLVLLEGMLAALPIVAAGASAVPEIVADGETGFVVAQDDPTAIADAAGRLLDDQELRARMSVAAVTRARDRFSVDRMADETLRVYEEALARSPAASTMRSAQDSTE